MNSLLDIYSSLLTLELELAHDVHLGQLTDDLLDQLSDKFQEKKYNLLTKEIKNILTRNNTQKKNKLKEKVRTQLCIIYCECLLKYNQMPEVIYKLPKLLCNEDESLKDISYAECTKAIETILRNPNLNQVKKKELTWVHQDLTTRLKEQNSKIESEQTKNTSADNEVKLNVDSNKNSSRHPTSLFGQHKYKIAASAIGVAASTACIKLVPAVHALASAHLGIALTTALCSTPLFPIIMIAAATGVLATLACVIYKHYQPAKAVNNQLGL